MPKETNEQLEALERASMHRTAAIQEGYFDKLAQFGFVPESKEQAQLWLKLATLTEQRMIATEQNGGAHALDKLAHDLASQAGDGSSELAEAEQELLNEAFTKSAAAAADNDVAASLIETLLYENSNQQ